MADPDNREVIDALKIAVARNIVVYASDAKSIDDYIEKFYADETQDINELIENIGDDALQIMRDEDEDVGRLQDLASEAPIIRLVNLIITRAVESRASDIHVEPNIGKKMLKSVTG
jgi:general secretion pathway protein E